MRNAESSAKLRRRFVVLVEKTGKTDLLYSIFEEPRMRKAYPTQLRFDTVPIQNVVLNLECRDSIVPVLRALQHVYANRQITRSILRSDC